MFRNQFTLRKIKIFISLMRCKIAFKNDNNKKFYTLHIYAYTQS